MILDVTELEGPGKVLYTTAVGGTFYIRVSFEEDYAILPIDGREFWCYGIENRNMTF
jgi:hypothetical protein